MGVRVPPLAPDLSGVNKEGGRCVVIVSMLSRVESCGSPL
jgi:hypothetical protein